MVYACGGQTLARSTRTVGARRPQRQLPDFTGLPLSWTEVPDGQDLPDFLSVGQTGPIGLELIEWLDGNQMGPSKTREARRRGVLRILKTNWKAEYQPQRIRGAFIKVEEKKIAAADEAGRRKEFFDCVAEVDRDMARQLGAQGICLRAERFQRLSLMQGYLAGIRFIGGDPHDSCWIDVDGDVGAYDPSVTVETLKRPSTRRPVANVQRILTR